MFKIPTKAETETANAIAAIEAMIVETGYVFAPAIEAGIDENGFAVYNNFQK